MAADTEPLHQRDWPHSRVQNQIYAWKFKVKMTFQINMEKTLTNNKWEKGLST